MANIMKKLVLTLAVLVPFVASAYDFSSQAPSGQTLYFNRMAGGVEVVYPGTASNTWGGYTMPSGALTIPAQVSHNDSLFPVLKVAVKAFFNTNITSLTIEEGVAELAINAFGSCANLVSVTLPTSIASVGSSAFAHATSLSEVWMLGTVPPASVSAYAFQQASLASCTLHVPCGALSNYTAAPWCDFGTVSDGLCSATLALSVNDPLRGSTTGGGTYATGTAVTISATAVPPYRFICWSDGDTINPRILCLQRDLALVAVFLVPLHDTLVQHDTTSVRDTVFLHDTIYSVDTVRIQPTFFRLQVLSDNPSAGIGVGNALLPAGTEVEIAALPLEGHRFLAWDDGGTDNPRRLTLTAAATYTAHFEPLGMELPATQWSLSVQGNVVVVGCRPGETVKVYDIEGRLVSALTSHSNTTRLQMPAAGLYIVQVANAPGRKITIR